MVYMARCMLRAVRRVIPTAAVALARRHGMSFLETSAAAGENVTHAFNITIEGACAAVHCALHVGENVAARAHHRFAAQCARAALAFAEIYKMATQGKLAGEDLDSSEASEGTCVHTWHTQIHTYTHTCAHTHAHTHTHAHARTHTVVEDRAGKLRRTAY